MALADRSTAAKSSSSVISTENLMMFAISLHRGRYQPDDTKHTCGHAIRTSRQKSGGS
jgi:hypothetical protein